MLALILACATGPADPRADILARLPASGPADPDAALLREDAPAACHGYAARAHAGEDVWIPLVVSAARGGGCVGDADVDALLAWAAADPARAEAWRGARAEWLARKDLPAAKALLAAPGHDASRLRIAVADGTPDADLAESVLAAEPRDGLACWIVARKDLADGDLFAAVEQAGCEGTKSARLTRVLAEALDAAGQTDAALAAYAEAGLSTHRAAILWQEWRRDEALPLLADPTPPAALQRGWMALAEARPVDLDALDDTPQARILGALATNDPGGIAELDGPEAAVARARAAAARKDASRVEAELAPALAADPALEPLHRAHVALCRAAGCDADAAMRAWDAIDPDHARLRGARGSRDLAWIAIAPWPPLPAPHGDDEVGRAWRAASALSSRTARLDALAALQAAHPELAGLAAARYALAAGLDAAPAGP